MARSTVGDFYRCDVCSQPTSRLLGFGAITSTDHVEDRSTTSGFSAVLGYCASHVGQIFDRFEARAHARGEVVWICDDPTPLRPKDVADWQETVDQLMAHVLAQLEDTPENAYIPLENPTQLPEQCPHCDGILSWNTGPYVTDAATRPDALAWECRDCHAAGMLVNAPPALTKSI
jgi:hypothetical protein